MFSATTRRRIIEIGRKALETIFKNEKVTFNSSNLNKILEYYKLANTNDLYYGVGVLVNFPGSGHGELCEGG